MSKFEELRRRAEAANLAENEEEEIFETGDGIEDTEDEVDLNDVDTHEESENEEPGQ